MAKRLRMTGADYVAIAISPALIMSLVGSLVFFLIEVFYAGEYHARLNYVFALFVFAAVLIARISIEMGSERAAAFALVLGIATFLVLQKFVEHPSVLSPLINLGLIVTVWWCAHRLTWDCTLIDDDEDASGAGLLQRVGIDRPEDRPPKDPSPESASNELLTEGVDEQLQSPRWWNRFVVAKKGPHAPGVWVLYFSLAALPLFGIGQHWIPAAEIGRRRYAFGLLAVYVFSALALLVTTSFLGLRRYLRQRNLEMPAPMAGTWVTIGAVLIAIVMFTAALLPRPAAEVTISQSPWQARSPEGLSPSQYGQGNDGAVEPERAGDVVSDNQDAPQGNAIREEEGEQASGDGGKNESGQKPSNESPNDAAEGSSSDDRSSNDAPPGDDQTGESSENTGAKAGQSAGNDGERRPTEQSTDNGQNTSDVEQETSQDGGEQRNGEKETSDESESRFRMEIPTHDSATDLTQVPRQVLPTLGGLTGILKLLFYLVVAVLLLYFAWKNRERITHAFGDILRSIRAFFAALFGGGAASDNAPDEAAATSAKKRRTFAEFRDPFASGMHRRASPEELVRYTFEAFEAWAGDRGLPRSVDQTPQELVRAAVAPQTPLHVEARRMIGAYSAIAYAGRATSREDADSLRELWRLMAAER